MGMVAGGGSRGRDGGWGKLLLRMEINVRLYEHEAKSLFARVGIPVKKEILVHSPREAGEAVEMLGGAVALKAQVLTGGRGKAGGIKLVDTPEEALQAAKEIMGLTIRGFPVEKLLVAPKLDIEQEFYVGVTIDRLNYKVVVVVCSQGGVDIEETAKKSPERIHKLSLGINDCLYPFQGIALAKKMGVTGGQVRQAGAIIVKLHKLFKKYDAKLVEINPLVRLTDGNYVAADARMSLDDDALFRHPELEEMGIEKRHEEGEMTERERQAREWGIPYLDLEGNIGMFPGGAGFGIMGNDFIQHFGGMPANFMDSGGGPSPERLAKMLVLLDENPRVKAIFGARFGGISRCDDFAKGVIMFLQEHGLSKPMVMRMTGNVWQEGVRLFEEAKKKHPELFEKVEIHGIETPIEQIAKRAVQLARE
jgi:succinyl-CoA synthetase beta subunit